MKKVAINALTVNPGGGVSVVREVARALSLSGLDVDVFLGAEKSKEALMDGQIKGVRVQVFLPFLPAYLRLFLGTFLFLFKRGYDAVLTPNYHSFCLGQSITLHLNLFSFMENASANHILEKIKRIDAELACRFADVNIFESSYIHSLAKSQLSSINNPKVIYMPINESFYRHDSQPDSIASKEILVISSPNAHKNNDVAMEAFSLFKEKEETEGYRLVFFGGQSKQDWDQYSALIDRLAIGEFVDFEGPCTPCVISERLSRAFCSMTCSSVESFCMVAVESMAAGCPVLVSDATSMPESVGDAGVVCADRNPAAFAEGLLSMLDEEKRQKLISEGKDHAQAFTRVEFSSQLADALGLS